MIVRTKTKRRLLILLGVFLFLLIGAGSYVVVRKAQVRRQNMALRQEGMTAFGKGDHRAALSSLARYVRAYPQDAEALRATAMACRQVPMAGGRHLAATVHYLRQYLGLRPEDAEARTALLQVYIELRYNSEAIEAAKRVLEKSPDDRAAVRAMAEALTGLRKPAEALPYAQRYVQLEPTDLEMQVLVLGLLDECGRNADIISCAEGLLEQNWSDSRFALLLGMAYNIANDWTSAEQNRARDILRRKGLEAKVERWDRQNVAKTLIQHAAQSVSDDTRYVHLVIRELDRLGLASDSLSLLQRTTIGRDDPWLRRLLVRRLWEAGRFADVDKAVEGLKPEDRDTEPEEHGFRAIALAQLGRKDAANAIAAALRGRSDDPFAVAWAAVIEHLVLADPPNALACLDPIHRALQARGRDLYLRYFLGEAYSRLGEAEQARELFTRVYQENPAWPMPLARLSRLLAGSGFREEAIAVAEAAWQRAPESVGYATNLAMVVASSVKADDNKRMTQLLDLVKRIQKAAPNEEQTLAVHVLLLARNGDRPAAEKAALAAINADPPLSKPVLLQLAQASREGGLGLEDKCFDVAQKAHGLAPDLVYARAIDRHRKGKGTEALAELEGALAKAPAGEAGAWRLARARLLEEMRDPNAAKAWIAIADDPAMQADLAVQREVIGAASVQSDRDFVSRAIERIRKLTGEHAIGWRLAKTRLLLSSPSGGDAAREAVTLMKHAVDSASSDPEVRQLYARALDRAGSAREAIEQMAVASRLNPASNTITLELARLYQSQSDFLRAREQIDRLSFDKLTPVERRQVVALLAQQGDSAKAMEVMQTSGGEQERDATDSLYLVDLYRRRNQLAQAEDLLNKLLEKPNLRVVRLAADFFASRGRKEDAQRILRKLDGLTLAAGQKEFALAQHEAVHGAPDRAVKLFAAAAQADPSNAIYAEHLVRQHLLAGQVAEAMTTAEAALKTAPASAGLQALCKHSVAVRAAAAEKALVPLAAWILETPADAEVVGEAVRIIADAIANSRPTATVVDQLRPLADRAVRFLPLQRLLITKYLQLGKTADAVTIATRCLRSAPNSPELAQLAAEVVAASGNWRQALVVANQWRELSLVNPLPVDLFIAQLHLRLNEPAAALKQIDPYVAAAQQGKDSASSLIVLVQARALLMDRQPAKAGALLWPRATQHPQWRAAWVELASVIAEPAPLAAWLERVSPIVPADSQDEQIALANAWYQAGARLNEPKHFDRARAMLDKLVARPDASAVSHFARAVMHEADKEPVKAEAAYRTALLLKPDHAVAKNNLAMILARRGEGLDEALALASDAVRAAPRIAGLHDTLAFVQIRQRDFASAITNLRRAIALEPDNAEFRVNLLAALVGSGDRAEATRVLREVEPLVNTSKLPPDVMDRLKTAREQLQVAKPL